MDDTGAVELDAAPAVTPDRLAAWLRDLRRRLGTVHPAAWCTVFGAVVFAVVFGRLGVQHHRNFGTWAFDMGIYDQAFWLVSHGKSWITVRGIDMWGHHTNLIAFVFAPFYWLGAGPEFLYVVQAIFLGAGAIPTYLIARDRLHSPWTGTLFAYVYLMYAPVQWIAWANFHPEALVITPLLFAWWFATVGNWRWCFISLVVALSTREDTAMAVFMMGLVLWITFRHDSTRDSDRRARDRRMALSVSLLGVVWYLVCMRLVIPHFNRGHQPFYVTSFYGHYGSNTTEIATEILTRPDRVVSDATHTDRIRFYRDLFLPWGGLPLGGLVQMLMALPQMLASVIGLQPYARMIRYQYTSVMIAPIVISSIEGAVLVNRYKFGRRFLLPWLLVCAYVTNIAWSPSPIGASYDAAWARPTERHDAMRSALSLVPDDASVTATFAMVPHLSHRDEIYDWPNPFEEANWGNDDGYRLPDPDTVDYLVLDITHTGEEHADLLAGLIGPRGTFEIVFEEDDVVVARRKTDP